MPLRVLIITPEFYGIETKIKLLLENSGYDVSWILNKTLLLDYHGTKSKLKFIRRIYFFLFSPQKNYIKNEFKKIENIKFDILFSINGHVICPYLFRKLKSLNKGLFSVLFLWDSFSKYSWTREIKFFNKAYTFDPDDSKNYQIEYKPNFYLKSDVTPVCDKKYDLFFAGKFNSGRLLLLDSIISQIEKSGVKYYIKLWPSYKIFYHSKIIYTVLKKVKLKSNWTENYLINYEAIEGILKRDYIIENRISYDEIQHYFMCSNTIIDLSFYGQTGYTHRLVEAMANGKKIITTNSNIKKERFYNQKQIRFIDEENPVIDCEWISEKSVFPIDNYFQELELSSWLKSILNYEIT